MAQGNEFRDLVEVSWQLKEAAGGLSLRQTEEATTASSEPLTDEERAQEEADEQRRAAERATEIEAAKATYDDAEEQFLTKKAEFEERYGNIVDVYYTTTIKNAGVALTDTSSVGVKNPIDWFLRLRRRFDWLRLHAHNLVFCDLPDNPEFTKLRVRYAELMHHIDAKQVSAQFMLRGLSQRVLLLRLFALRRDMLADIDKARHDLGYRTSIYGTTDADYGDGGDPRPRATAERLTQAISGYEREYKELSDTYSQAATREARIIYLSGMLTGLLLLLIVFAGLRFLLSLTSIPINLRLFFTCAAAGAVGAFVSVLQRMSSGKFTVNHEVGREYVQRLAYFRPFIGSIFGLVVFLALTADIAHVTPPSAENERYAFFAFTAFLAGFSERFAKELLGSPSGDDTEGGDDDAGKPGTAQTKLLGRDGDGKGRAPESETSPPTIIHQPAAAERGISSSRANHGSLRRMALLRRPRTRRAYG